MSSNRNLPTFKLTELNAAMIILKKKENPDFDKPLYMCGSVCPYIDYLPIPSRACVCGKLKKQRGTKWYRYLEEKEDYPFNLIIAILVTDENFQQVPKWVPVVCLGEKGDKYIILVAKRKIEGNHAILYLQGVELTTAVQAMAIEMESEMFFWKDLARAMDNIHKALDAVRGEVALARIDGVASRVDDVQDELSMVRVQQEKDAKARASQQKQLTLTRIRHQELRDQQQKDRIQQEKVNTEMQDEQQKMKGQLAALHAAQNASAWNNAPVASQAVASQASDSQASDSQANAVLIPPSAIKTSGIEVLDTSEMEPLLSPSMESLLSLSSAPSLLSPSSAASVYSATNNRGRRLSRSSSPSPRKSKCASPFGSRSSPTSATSALTGLQLENPKSNRTWAESKPKHWG